MVRHSYRRWRRYVPVASRRLRAAREIAGMAAGGRHVSPVEITGRRIATTFWGDAWCSNLESYSDFSNRLPRGRTFVRNGSVVDLQIEAGRVRALVSGSSMYDVDIEIAPLAKRRWLEVKRQCAGQIGSLVELLRGAISASVMKIVTRDETGLFPSPREISLSCSCPDWATMCKHVAATLYGVGARLDHAPELLFVLRAVDPAEMVAAAVDQPAADGRRRRGRVLESGELSSIFGIDVDDEGGGRARGGTEQPGGGGRRRRSAQAPRTRTPRTRPVEPVELPPQVLQRLHDRAFELIAECEVLREWIHDVRWTRGRFYLWRDPGGHLARITPLGPRSLLLETRRGRSWVETQRGPLPAALRALAVAWSDKRP